jgi:hypothetical protein
MLRLKEQFFAFLQETPSLVAARSLFSG